jgi:hypothetical protein
MGAFRNPEFQTTQPEATVATRKVIVFRAPAGIVAQLPSDASPALAINLGRVCMEDARQHLYIDIEGQFTIEER